MISGESLKAVIDVRTIAPAERHPLIYRTFDTLQVGESFLLIGDRDPRPLHYQLAHEREGQFMWAYLESGPSIWQVMIAKIHLDEREGA